MEFNGKPMSDLLAATIRESVTINEVKELAKKYDVHFNTILLRTRVKDKHAILPEYEAMFIELCKIAFQNNYKRVVTLKEYQ